MRQIKAVSFGRAKPSLGAFAPKVPMWLAGRLEDAGILSVPAVLAFEEMLRTPAYRLPGATASVVVSAAKAVGIDLYLDSWKKPIISGGSYCRSTERWMSITMLVAYMGPSVAEKYKPFTYEDYMTEVTEQEFIEFIKKEFQSEHFFACAEYQENPEHHFSKGFVAHLNELFKTKIAKANTSRLS